MVVNCSHIRILSTSSPKADPEFIYADLYDVDSQVGAVHIVKIKAEIDPSYIKALAGALGVPPSTISGRNVFVVGKRNDGTLMTNWSERVALPCPPYCSGKSATVSFSMYP